MSEVGLRLDPPEPRTAVARTEPPPAPSAPPAPDAVPSERAPCPPGDDACWRRSTLRALDRRPPACEPYVAELDAHLRRIDRDPDPNGRPAPDATPDLDTPAREAGARVRDWASPYPDGAIVQGSDGFARRDVHVTNAPPAPPPTPSRPSDACRAEWSDAAIAAVPTLDCTREIVDDAHWRGSDGLVKAAEAPFSPIGSLPLIGQILATKARQVAADRSWMSIFALRWMDRLVAARQRGDAGYLDRAFAGLADRPDERRALADHLRRWLSSPSWSAWHGAIRAVYEERFASLYPAAADAAGMPALSRFPTRMWWATNWLSAAVRRGLSADDAAGLLRCGPDAGPGADVMRDLGPMLATDPRFGRLAADLAARL